MSDMETSTLMFQSVLVEIDDLFDSGEKNNNNQPFGKKL